MLLSVPLALEYEDVLFRPEHLAASGATPEQMSQFLESLLTIGSEVTLGRFRRPNLMDPGDEHILNLALRGNADGLVTQNLRHFPGLRPRFGVELYSAQGALELLRK